MTTKIEAGKFYRTRDGRKVGPMEDSGDSLYPWKDGENAWMKDGHFLTRSIESADDLVSEWVDEPSPNTDRVQVEALSKVADVSKMQAALNVYASWAYDICTLGEYDDLEKRMNAVGVTLTDLFGWWCSAPKYFRNLIAEREK